MNNFQLKFELKYGRAALENVIKSICNLEKPMSKLPKSYSGNFMKGKTIQFYIINLFYFESNYFLLSLDAREALLGVGMIVLNKTNNTTYPDKGSRQVHSFNT